MKRMIQNERGIALAVAIIALVVVGALVAGSFFVGMQEQRVGRNTLSSQQAFSAAQEGAQLTVANWGGGSYANLTAGDSAQFDGQLADGTGWYRGWVRKLSDMLYLVESEGFSRDDLTRQKVGLLVRLRPLELNLNGALKTQGAIQIGGSSYINGYDSQPDGWSGCGPMHNPLPGIRTSDTSLIEVSGGTVEDYVNGDPVVTEDTTISDSTLTTFGDQEFADLYQMSNLRLPGGNRKIEPAVTITNQCDRSVITNWGSPLDPTGPCGSYFPFVYITGNASINGVQGQGVLVVDGDLSVQGNFQFFGPVIVKGMLKTTGTGGHFNGGVLAANVSLEQNTVLGNAVINFSSCALIKALTYTAPGALMKERSWVSVYN